MRPLGKKNLAGSSLHFTYAFLFFVLAVCLMCKPIGNFDVCKQIGLCRVSYNNKKNSHRLTDTRAPDWRPIRAWHWALISSDATDPGLSRHLLDPLCTPIKRTWHESRLSARARFDPIACVRLTTWLSMHSGRSLANFV